VTPHLSDLLHAQRRHAPPHRPLQPRDHTPCPPAGHHTGLVSDGGTDRFRPYMIHHHHPLARRFWSLARPCVSKEPNGLPTALTPWPGAARAGAPARPPCAPPPRPPPACDAWDTCNNPNHSGQVSGGCSRSADLDWIVPGDRRRHWRRCAPLPLGEEVCRKLSVSIYKMISCMLLPGAVTADDGQIDELVIPRPPLTARRKARVEPRQGVVLQHAFPQHLGPER
jgi:hypothetical protein